KQRRGARQRGSGNLCLGCAPVVRGAGGGSLSFAGRGFAGAGNGAGGFLRGDRIGRTAGVVAEAQRRQQVVHGQLHHGPAGGQRGAADMRGQHHVAQRQQLGTHLGFALVDVQPGRGQAAPGQRVGQGQLVDQAAAGDVYQGGGRLHPRQRGGIDDVVAVLRVRQDQ